MKLPFPGNYCIDTCALIDLMKKLYPPDIFPSLWKDLENLVSYGRLIAPREVFKELEKYSDKKDELLKWVKKNRRIFKELTEEQLQLVRDILQKFPNLIDPNKTVADADPFIIALAISEGCSVITSEQLGSPEKPKIPNVCNDYKIKCLSLPDFFREQKWKY